MRELTINNVYKYKAFVSYSRRDEKVAAWLQRSLERYRIPKHLRGSDQGQLRLGSVFRDREDLRASSDLGGSLQEALSQSEYLIVVCSQNAVKSQWVKLEIADFIKQRGINNVLAVIVSGEPNAMEAGHPESEECFPESLRFELNDDGTLSTRQIEPLAPDLREGGDGRRLTKLKLVASLLQTDLNQVIQREAQRRIYQAGMITAMAIVVSLALTLLSYNTLQANKRTEAARKIAEQRLNTSEGLVEFMLSDLRYQLEPVGRLEVLDSVGERALEYYDSMVESEMDANATGRRARAMLLLGEIQLGRGVMSKATAIFTRAAQDTERLLKIHPQDTNRIYDHAQSTFWLGYIALEISDLEAAYRHFNQYLALAKDLVRIEPENVDWQMELHYAYSNLGSLAYEQRKYEEAAPFFLDAFNIILELSETHPQELEYQRNLAEAASWLTSTFPHLHRYSESENYNQIEISAYTALLEKNPQDKVVESRMIKALANSAFLTLIRGRIDESINTLLVAREKATGLIELDEDNADYWKDFAILNTELAEVQIVSGQIDDAYTSIEQCLRANKRLRYLNVAITGWSLYDTRCGVTQARYWTMQNKVEQALEILSKLQREYATLPGFLKDHRDYPKTTGLLFLYLGDVHKLRGDQPAAESAWQQAADSLSLKASSTNVKKDVGQEHLRFLSLFRLGELDQAMVIGNALQSRGYAHPEFSQAYATLDREYRNSSAP